MLTQLREQAQTPAWASELGRHGVELALLPSSYVNLEKLFNLLESQFLGMLNGIVTLLIWS